MNENASQPADDVIYVKVDKPNYLTANFLIGLPFIMGWYWLPKASSVAEGVGYAGGLLIMLLFGICALVTTLWKGTKTITLRRDSLTINKNGTEEKYDLDSMNSIERKRNKYSGAEQVDAIWLYKIKMASGEKIKFQTNDPLLFLTKTFDQGQRFELSKKLSAKGKVQWVAGVTIFEDGIKATTRGVIPRKKLLTWEEIKEIQVEKKHASVFVHGKDRPVAKIELNDHSFFAGYYLFKELHAASRQDKPTPVTYAALL